jgi:hypothetical protein
VTDQTPEPDDLTEEEIEANRGEELPDRQAMMIVTPGFERPIPVDGVPFPPETNPPGTD